MLLGVPTLLGPSLQLGCLLQITVFPLKKKKENRINITHSSYLLLDLRSQQSHNLVLKLSPTLRA